MNRLFAAIGMLVLYSSMQGAYAQNVTTLPQNCELLGDTPSLIIKFNDMTSNFQSSSALDMNRLAILSAIAHVSFTASKAMVSGAYIVYFSPNSSSGLRTVSSGCYAEDGMKQLLERLQAQPNIEYVDPNRLLSIASVKNEWQTDPPTPGEKQWDMLDPTVSYGINTHDAWNYTMGLGTIVAVLDTGLFPNASLTPLSSFTITFNNNGGTSATSNAPSCIACSGSDHGTHVAGTMASSGNGSYNENIYGVAPLSQVLVVNVFTKVTNSGTCGGVAPCLLAYTSDTQNALNWLGGTSVAGLPNAPTGVASVNLSLGGSGSCGTSYQNAFNKVLAQNISVVVAAGNSNIDAINASPANCAGVITVASTGPTGFRAYYSNYSGVGNSTVKIAAPGGDAEIANPTGEIYSTINASYGYKQGTSMAAPHVAGLIGLLKTYQSSLTPTQVLEILQGTATAFSTGAPPRAAQACTNPAYSCGAGIINAVASLRLLAGANPLVWTNSGITISEETDTGMQVDWHTAEWTTLTTTVPVAYTVVANGVPSSQCTGIEGATTCVLTDLQPNTLYTITVSATDKAGALTPIVSQSATATTGHPSSITAPTLLSTAKRNPLNNAAAYVYYNNLGSTFSGITYSVQGLADSTTVTLDTVNRRFIVWPVTTPKAVSVTVTASFDLLSAISNSATIPSILGDK